MSRPEAEARKNIDAALDAAGWVVQDAKADSDRLTPGMAPRADGTGRKG